MSEEISELSVKRRMPESLRKHLLRVQGGKMYLPAAYRLLWFRDECPDWGIVTELIEGGQEAGFATVKAFIFNPEGRLIGTGHKTETKQDFPAGWTEKAETGSVARALANCGFGTQFSEDVDAPKQTERPATRSNVQNASPQATAHTNGVSDMTPSPPQEEDQPANPHKASFFDLWYRLDMPTDATYLLWVARLILVKLKEWPEQLPIHDATEVDEDAWAKARSGLKAYKDRLDKQNIVPGQEPAYLNAEVTV